MTDWIFVFYTKDFSKDNQYYRPNISVFTSKTELYKLLKEKLKNYNIENYRNSEEIYDHIIKNGGCLIDEISIRIQKKKLNNFTNKELNIKFQKTIEKIIEESKEKKWKLFTFTEGLDAEDEKINISFDSLKEAEEWIKNSYIIDYNFVLNSNNKMPKIEDIPTLKYPKNDQWNWQNDPEYAFYKLPNETTKYNRVLLSKSCGEQIYFVINDIDLYFNGE